MELAELLMGATCFKYGYELVLWYSIAFPVKTSPFNTGMVVIVLSELAIVLARRDRGKIVTG